MTNIIIDIHAHYLPKLLIERFETRAPALPYALGRLVRTHTIAHGKYADPRKGFEAMFFDSLVFDPDGLDFLIKKAGKGRVMLGSDMPFPIGDPAPQKVVHATSLDEHERCAVLGTTAQRLFCLRHDAARDPIGGA